MASNLIEKEHPLVINPNIMEHEGREMLITRPGQEKLSVIRMEPGKFTGVKADQMQQQSGFGFSQQQHGGGRPKLRRHYRGHVKERKLFITSTSE